LEGTTPGQTNVIDRRLNVETEENHKVNSGRIMGVSKDIPNWHFQNESLER
jgi:hypothetical protein